MNPFNNILKMHLKAKKAQDKAKEEELDKKREERAQRNEELKKRVEETKEKKKKGDLKEPPFMDTIMNFLGGFKIEVKRIHIRYEDDYFQHLRPFSFGVMIESISLDNSDTDWTFESPLSIMITKNRPQNTVNKELSIKNVRVYWNSMSEIFIPTSLWEQTRGLKYQIFEAMDASFLKDIMLDAFKDHAKMQYTHLVAPFSILTSINLKKSFN